MDIYLSVNNREQVICLPVLPAEFTVTKPQSNEIFETITQGQLKLIGTPALKGILIESFFPARDYPFLKDRSYKGFEYVYIIDKWVEAKLPIRLIITDTPINMVCCVDDFSYTIKKDGDLYYSLTLGEVKLI
jgi:hypothetical protein